MSTLESLKYDEDQDYALEFALNIGEAQECDECYKPFYLKDLTEIDGRLYCEDCIIDIDEEPE